jgi:hypothetical protein
MELVSNYFFLDEKLYKKIRVVKTEDYVVAWSYEDEKRVWINYSIVRRNGSKAYDLSEVSKLIDMKKVDILSYINRRLVDPPSGRLYTIKNRVPGKWMWSEKDILDLRQSLFELAPKNKYGEPYTSTKLISKPELLSRIRKDVSFYVRNENGEFVKVWRAE